MDIKQVADTDLAIVVNITHETIKGIYPRYYPKGAVDFFLAHHSAENIKCDILLGNIFLLTVDGAPVGTVTIKNNEICRLFVLSEQQGKGYGKALLEYSEKEISQISTRICLDASLPAKKIYLQYGYREIESHAILTENGDYLCYDVMEKAMDFTGGK